MSQDEHREVDGRHYRRVDGNRWERIDYAYYRDRPPLGDPTGEFYRTGLDGKMTRIEE